MLRSLVGSEMCIRDRVKSEVIQPILNNSYLLLSMINDIIDYSRIKRNTLRPCFREFDPREMIREVIQLFEIQAKKKKLTLEMIVDNSIPVSYTHLTLPTIYSV
eukprot:TRINITY_DN3233_c0_g1_i8.p1 TRINITY_DN3233_c0_g1~~TRINITY_DN3233_c0_g1_i8.p1  ORF type:complete len:104 (-),score=23.33 TRINITY_DN3233_c0_g1_i8:35-346(-)